MKRAVIVGLVAGFVLFSAWVKSDLRRGASPIEGLAIGEPMPDFILKDLSGTDVSFSQVVTAHKCVAINFWASWCGPCRLEMPGFERTYATRQKDGFVILGVNEDSSPSDRDAYLQKKPVTFPVLVDADGALMRKLKIRALPTTILVGGDGKIRMVTEGIQQYLGMMVDAELKRPAGKQ